MGGYSSYGRSGVCNSIDTFLAQAARVLVTVKQLTDRFCGNAFVCLDCSQLLMFDALQEEEAMTYTSQQ